MKLLRVKGKFLFEGEKPFFWLGDTAWELFHKLNEEEIILYLKNRKGLGFNIIQAILLTPTPTKKTERLSELESTSYWNFVHKIINIANDLGLYMALFPTWSSYIKGGYLNQENVKEYAKFLTSFFQQDNIIWVLGGDTRGDACFEVFDIFGKTLRQYDSKRLITFHPFGRTGSYLWFNDKDWLDFNMFQSGHRRYDQLDVKVIDDDSMDEAHFGESSYKYVIKNFSYSIKKPCLDAEPSYEGVVQGLHDNKEPYWEAYHIRRYAYFSVLEGACGFTYGNNSVIQFWTHGTKGNYGVRESWQEGLHSPGGAQMQYLKYLMESIDFTKGEAHPEYVRNQKGRCERISCFAGKKFIICYTFYGDEIKLDLSKYKDVSLLGYWINPENSARSYFGKFKDLKSYAFKPTKKRELSNDWVLLLIEE